MILRLKFEHDFASLFACFPGIINTGKTLCKYSAWLYRFLQQKHKLSVLCVYVKNSDVSGKQQICKAKSKEMHLTR